MQLQLKQLTLSNIRRTAARARPAVQQLVISLVGATIAGLGYSLFQVPFDIAAGGLSGIAIIVTHFTGWPVGIMILVMNVPLMVLGYSYLGRWRFVFKTVMSVIVFSASADLFLAYLPDVLAQYPVTDDVLLSAVYGGIVGGIGGGLVYRAGSSLGGTGILGRIVQQRTGFPLSQTYFYTDGLIIVTAGLVFGWELALYALLTLVLNGLAADYTLEGPSSVRTATIITDNPQKMAEALMEGLGHGVSRWQITGGYTSQPHHMLLCTVYRPQVNDLKQIVADTDPNAFVIIGMAHQALGSGFIPLDKVRDSV